VSGHYRWADLKPVDYDAHSSDVQMAYVDGYALALEDLLKELKALQAKEGTPGSEVLLLEQRVARNGAYGSVRAVLTRLLTSTNDTMNALRDSRRKVQERP
jgi:hypothetical protein